MKALVLDIETRVEIIIEEGEDGKKKKVIDNSPFNPDNYIVSVNWRKVEDGVIGPDNHLVFKHNDQPIGDDPKPLQDALDWADVVVAHNAKYDIMYLLEAGFRLPELCYCTLVGEYIIARGTREVLSLEETAIRRKVTHKKSDLTKEYWDEGIGFEAMPLPIVLEYADADVLSCAEIYLAQLKEWLEEANQSLQNIVTLMNDMLWFIVEIERNGCSIDMERLDTIGEDYVKELAILRKEMEALAQSVMGDTPFSLTSNVDVSKIIYSREVKDRDRHKKLFNIGVDFRGKKLHPPYMTDSQFVEAVRQTTQVIKRTVAEHCFNCHGKGWIQKVKKDGTNHKRTNKCPVCDGRGMLYLPTTQIAGFKLVPLGPASATINGFACDKEDIDNLILQAKAKGKLDAASFLVKKKRLNAINTYLNSFVKGIKRWCRGDFLLHAGFNQTVTKTGRLSSSGPNFQNLPKGKKFPVRKAIKSRFVGGHIMEADYSGLEFVIAGELSRDPQIIEDITTGKDIHAQTACIVYELPFTEIKGRNWKDGGENEDKRSGVKPDTFAPIYGGQGANKPPHIRRYYQEFFNIYKRHGEWQREQMDDVLKFGKIRTPSGREYAFPGTKRIKGNKTTNATMIVNYPVQGFATGDIVPLACIRMLREFKRLALKSKLILTVHDSIVADVYPGEEKQVYEAFKWAMTRIEEEIKERWGYTMVLPLRIEVSMGKSLGELDHVNDNNFLDCLKVA